MVNGWRKRYFVLEPNGTLKYWKQQAYVESQPCGGELSCVNATVTLTTTHEFAIETSEKTLCLKAECEQDRDRWLKHLRPLPCHVQESASPKFIGQKYSADLGGEPDHGVGANEDDAGKPGGTPTPLVRVTTQAITNRELVTGLVDEADRERLIDALHNFVKKSLPKDKAGKYPVANPKVLKSWSRENLEKLDMIDLVEFETTCYGNSAYRSPLRMPVYVAPLNEKTCDWQHNPLQDFLRLADKSEVFSGSKEVLTLLLSCEVFDRGTRFNGSDDDSLKEMEGMVIQVAKAEQEVALMADACRRAKEVCAMSTGNAVEEATRKLDMATANLKNAEEELKKTRSMRFQRQFSDDTSIEEEILDARSLHYSIKASPMSAITLRTDAREGALIEPDAAFFLLRISYASWI